MCVKCNGNLKSRYIYLISFKILYFCEWRLFCAMCYKISKAYQRFLFYIHINQLFLYTKYKYSGFDWYYLFIFYFMYCTSLWIFRIVNVICMSICARTIFSLCIYNFCYHCCNSNKMFYNNETRNNDDEKMMKMNFSFFC